MKKNQRRTENEAQNEEDKTKEEYMQTGTHSTQQILQIKKMNVDHQRQRIFLSSFYAY